MLDQDGGAMATTDQTAWKGSRSRSLSRKHLQTLATLSVLVLMCFVFTLLSDRFLTLSNFQNLMRNTAPLAIAGCGMTAVMIARGIDLSVGSVLAASTVLAASLAVAGVPLYPAFALGLAFGAVAGLANGLIIAGMGVSAIIVTLGMLNIARGIAYLISPSAILVGLPPNWSDLGTGRIWIFPFPDPDRGRGHRRVPCAHALLRSSGSGSTRSAATRKRRAFPASMSSARR